MAPIVGEVEGPRLAAIFTMQESLSERLAADQHSSRLGDRPLTFSEMPPGPHITQYYCDNWDDVPLVWGSSAPSSSTYPVFGWHLYGDVAKGCPPPSVIATASPPVPPDPITPPPPPPGKPLPSTEQPTPPPSYPPPWKAHLYPPFMPELTDPSPSEEDVQLPAAKSVPELDDPAPPAEEGKRTTTEMLPPCSTHKSSESTKPQPPPPPLVRFNFGGSGITCEACDAWLSGPTKWLKHVALHKHDISTDPPRGDLPGQQRASDLPDRGSSDYFECLLTKPFLCVECELEDLKQKSIVGTNIRETWSRI